jgi:hypothetical protein
VVTCFLIQRNANLQVSFNWLVTTDRKKKNKIINNIAELFRLLFGQMCSFYVLLKNLNDTTCLR